MTATCINLRKQFGDKYRISHEESYAAEHSEFRAAEEPWLQIIPCQHGHICPWGGELLAACTNRKGPISARLRKLKFLERDQSQDGDDGINAVFHVQHFDAVAEIMQPKRKRAPKTPEQLAACEANLKAYRFPAKNCERTERQRARTPRVDTFPVQAVQSVS